MGSVTTRFLWDGAELLGELDSQNKLLKSYVHGPEVDEVLYQEDYIKNETLFFHQDHLESTVALTDSQGVLKESYTYDPYGKLMTAKDKSGNQVLTPSTRILFTGREYDQETNLYYNRARYYDPSLGRFLSADPKGYDAGLNLYAYTHNNPLSFRDPSGLDVYWMSSFFSWVVSFFSGGGGGGYSSGGGGNGGGGFWSSVGRAFGYVASSIGNAVSSAVSSIGSAVSSTASAVASAVSNAVSAVASVASNVASAVASAVSSVANAVGSAVSQAASAVGNVVRSAASAIGNVANAIGSGLAQVGRGIQQAVRNNFFRPPSAEYKIGSERVRFRLGPLDFSFGPGQGLMKVIEDLIPTMHPFAATHDALLGSLERAGMPLAIPGVPFLFHPANVPTMPLAYVAATAGAVAQTVVDVARS